MSCALGRARSAAGYSEFGDKFRHPCLPITAQYYGLTTISISFRKIRMFHAFGDPRIKLAGAVHIVEREQFVTR
jgi:hypothetical protein